MFPKISVVKTAVERLFNATASIYVLAEAEDQYGVTRPNKTAYGNIRCRISYGGGIGPPVSSDTVDTSSDTITMIYDGTVLDIPDGSQVTVVWDDGRTEYFYNASWPKVYSHHAEMTLRRLEVHP